MMNIVMILVAGIPLLVLALLRKANNKAKLNTVVIGQPRYYNKALYKK